ncbi:hypothetical protein EHQ31_16050 [Leptospira montravelensis]|uniref:Yip1 domain-containing protein n=1 Tax=Leptospira montravelensis TaxID=2484961 RepID=A0ABY2LNR3_9LEPT|nr:hypothetical protein [Leptospira montravelensis]TGK80147.1 hypothetical protein EHQ19_10625 [Leptospira montravelensis]TGL00317.1 hypothetical protein EHQ31_16050 [Leptospira montravelensis]
MRDFFFDLVDVLELVFLDPLRYSEEVQEIPFAASPVSSWMFSILSALSLSVGMSILSAPYTVSTLSFLFFGFIANLLLFRFFPFFYALVTDYYVQKKGRTPKLLFLILFARHSVVLFLLFAPVCIVFHSLGISGIGTGFFLLLSFILLYSLVLSRGLKSIYELRNRDSLKFSFYALGLTILFPFLMNLYTATSILQSISGGF